jgi:hypothetical protein
MNRKAMSRADRHSPEKAAREKLTDYDLAL